MLEVLTVNVKVGSSVFEEGHTVLLSWCDSAGEVEQVRVVAACMCWHTVGSLKRSSSARENLFLSLLESVALLESVPPLLPGALFSLGPLPLPRRSRAC